MSKSQRNSKERRYKWGSKTRANSTRKLKRSTSKRNCADEKSEYQRRIESLNGYIEWAQQKWDQGYELYLLSFMFNEMGGKKQSKIERMKADIERFYGRLATRFARKPRSPGGMRLLPSVFVYPDNRVYKRCIRDIPDFAVNNDGLHFHGVCAADRRGRVREALDKFVAENHDDLVGRNRQSRDRKRLPALTKIQRVHVEPVTHLPGKVAEYALKSMKRPWFSHDDMIILPKPVRDLPDISHEMAYEKRAKQADAKEARRERRLLLRRVEWASERAKDAAVAKKTAQLDRCKAPAAPRFDIPPMSRPSAKAGVSQVLAPRAYLPKASVVRVPIRRLRVKALCCDHRWRSS